MRSPYFNTLSGFRGIAALAVIILHYAPYFGVSSLPMAITAVDFFFLISGVVIEASYGEKLRTQMSFGIFLSQRLIRLYPLYIFGTILTLLAIWVAPNHQIFVSPHVHVEIPMVGLLTLMAGLFAPLTFTPDLYPLDPPAWSLFFELLANIIYAALIPYFTQRRLIFFVGVSGIILISLTLSRYDETNRIVWGLARVSFSFGLGVLLFRQYAAKPQTFNRKGIILPCLIATLVVALAMRPPDPAIAGLAQVIVVFPGVVWLAMRTEPDKFTLPIWQRSGDLSYGAYALHAPLARLLLTLLFGCVGFHGDMKGSWLGLWLLLVLLPLCALLERFFDQPLRNMLKKQLPNVSRSKNAVSEATKPIVP